MSPDPEPPEIAAPTALPAGDAIVADQVAAHATEAHGHHGPFHTHCENCGTKLEGPWCHRCGQHDFEFHRSFWHVFMEALETLFHFEGKFFRNIVTLLFQPGRLTAEFNAGKRAAQMPPFRLYIFVSFIFFLLIFLGDKDGDEAFFRETEGPRRGLSVNGKPVDVAALGEKWREAAAQLKAEDWQDAAKVTQAIEQVAAKAEETATSTTKGKPDEVRLVDQLRQAAEEVQVAAKENSAAGRKTESGLAAFLNDKGRRAMEPENRRRLAEAFKHHVPHLLMFCLPLFALYTRFLFRKAGQVYLQHLVLAVHFHTFIYLWVLCRNGWAALAGLPDWGLEGWVTGLCDFWLYLYPVLMLRRLFANSWPKTLVKAFVLAFGYGLTLGFGFFLTAVALFLML